MREVFNLQKTGVYWWGLLTALVYLIPGAWIKGLASFVRTVDWFRRDRAPFSWFDNLGGWIDTLTKSTASMVQFDPQTALIRIGNFGIPNLAIAVLFGVIVIVVAFISFRRATETKGILDDFIAMALIYIVLRVVGVASASLHVPVIDFFQREQPYSYLAVLSLFMFFLLIAGKGAVDSRVFFIVVFELVVVWLVIFPTETAQALAWLIELPTAINYVIFNEPALRNYYPMIVTGWALLGILAAAASLYSVGKAPPPPSPAPKPAGGGEKKK